MCIVLLPPGGYPIAVNKYIISKFNTVSLPQKNRTFFFPVLTDRKNDITPVRFSVTYPYAENKEDLALAVRT
jgi:hypothetical protein